jgi:hypothetical protein
LAFGVIGKVAMMTLRGEDSPSIRAFLLSQVLEFVGRACTCPGVTRISLVGSLTTSKPNPKDADVLVTVDDEADLMALAAAGRRLKGRAQSHSAGADIFLADPSGRYIGRTCHWRECWFGKRISCDAQHCGRRHFLHDDLWVIKLDSVLVKNPPIDLWPTVVRRVQVPEDVEGLLLKGLEVEVHTH